MVESKKWGRVAILGPGLLGGSLALALKASGSVSEVVIWGRRPEAVSEALELGVCDAGDTEVSAVIGGADLVILATPVPVMGEVFQRGAEALSDGALVTDVGSVKGVVVNKLEPLVAGNGGTFVGSHPMAGSENTGLSHSRANLFQGAACIVTPTGQTSAGAVEVLRGFWRSVGCRVTTMDAARHDSLVARISHMPHAVASAVVSVALADGAEIADLAGDGFRDSTRVAAGDASLWRGILEENRQAVVPVLRAMSDEISKLANTLDRGDSEALFQFLDRAKKLRQGCRPRDPK